MNKLGVLKLFMRERRHKPRVKQTFSYSFEIINFDIVVSIGIFCSTANAIAPMFLTSYAISFDIATVVAKLNILENELFTDL